MTNARAYGIAATVALALGMAWWGGIGRAQQQDGVGEKAGEKLDEVGRKIKKGLEKAEGTVKEGLYRTRDSVHNMGVTARVYGRLHWDTALNTSTTLNVKVEHGVATLTGSVPTAKAKAKAVTLAAETVGVTKVIDELTIPASQADPAPTRTPF
jgi:hyperosmotically inducible periplasmic protein